MSLLEQAKNIKKRKLNIRDITENEIELVIGWLNDEVNISRMGEVLKYGNGGTVLYFISRVLKEAYKRGIIEIKLEEYKHYKNL